MAEAEDNKVLTLTAEIVASYVGSVAHLKADELPGIIKSVREALQDCGSAASDKAALEAGPSKATKAQIRKSITPDGLVSFIDNKPYKTLKRHLTRHGMSMGDYRDRFGLPND